MKKKSITISDKLKWTKEVILNSGKFNAIATEIDQNATLFQEQNCLQSVCLDTKKITEICMNHTHHL